MREMIEVKRLVFLWFLQWYTDNVGQISREPNTISDRINYKNQSGALVGYKSMYYTTTYYIEKECYKLMMETE